MLSSRIVGVNERVCTYGNATRDYTSLAAWEADTDKDLVSSAQSEVLECYADAEIFLDFVWLMQAITNSNFFRIIRSASGQGHNGTPNVGIKFKTLDNTYLFAISENYSSVQDIIGLIDITYMFDCSVFYINNSFGAVYHGANFIGCIAANASNSIGTANGFYIVLGYSEFPGAMIVNCLACNCKTDGFKILNYNDHTDGYFYNNTAVNNGQYGFNNIESNPDIYSKNCCAVGNGVADWNGNITKTTCTEESASPIFVDPDNNDFHLSPIDTICKNQGTDLSKDEIFPFNDDIDGDER